MRTQEKLHKIRGDVSDFVKSLIKDSGGFAAVEFAMIVPVMIIMLLGSVEVSDALTVDRHLNTIADSLSDLVARSPAVTAADLKDIMRIADSLLGKYPRQNLAMEVVSLEPNAGGVMQVAWSYDSKGGQPYAPGSTYPGSWNGMVSGANSLIVAKAKYLYRSPVGQFIHGNISLSHVASYESRQGKVVGP